jgi:phage regulator Rha-like protein
MIAMAPLPAVGLPGTLSPKVKLLFAKSARVAELLGKQRRRLYRVIEAPVARWAQVNSVSLRSSHRVAAA